MLRLGKVAVWELGKAFPMAAWGAAGLLLWQRTLGVGGGGVSPGRATGLHG